MQDTDNVDVYLISPAFIEFIDQYGSYKLASAIQYHVEFYSYFPYITYSDYMNDEGDVRIEKLMKVTNVGRREAIEYCELVERYLSKEGEEFRKQPNQYIINNNTFPENDYISDDKYKILNLSLLDLVDSSDTSKRLRNRIAIADEMTYIPIKTVADYIHAGRKAKNIILSIPGMGNKTARELDELIHKILIEHAVIDTDQVITSPEYTNLIPTEITKKLPGLIRKSIKEQAHDILIHRAIHEYTLEHTAQFYSLTKERIRQIEADAIRHILKLYGNVFDIVSNKLYVVLGEFYGEVPLTKASEILGISREELKLLVYVLFKKKGQIRIKGECVTRVDA